MSSRFWNRQLNYFIDSSDEEDSNYRIVTEDPFTLQKQCPPYETDYFSNLSHILDLNLLYELNVANNVVDDSLVLEAPADKEIVIYMVRNQLAREVVAQHDDETGYPTNMVFKKGINTILKGRKYLPILIAREIYFAISPEELQFFDVYYQITDRSCLADLMKDACMNLEIEDFDPEQIEDEDLSETNFAPSIEPIILRSNEVTKLTYDHEFDIIVYRGLNWVTFHNDGPSVDPRNPFVGDLTPRSNTVTPKTIYNLTLIPRTDTNWKFSVLYEGGNYYKEFKTISGRNYVFKIHFVNATYMVIISDVDCITKFKYNDTDRLVTCPSRPATVTSCSLDLDTLRYTESSTEMFPETLFKSVCIHAQPYVTNFRPKYVREGITYNYGLGYDSALNFSYTDATDPYGITYYNYWPTQKNINAIYLIWGNNADPRSSAVFPPVQFEVIISVLSNNYSNNEDSINQTTHVSTVYGHDGGYNSDSWNVLFIRHLGRPIMSNVRSLTVEIKVIANTSLYYRGIFVDISPSTCANIAPSGIISECSATCTTSDVFLDEDLGAFERIGITNFTKLDEIRQ